MLKQVLKEHNIVGVAGMRSTAKTSLILSELLQIRKQHPNVKIAVFGVNEELKMLLHSNNITFLESQMDILDLRMKDTIIFIDEMALFFDTSTRSKQLDKLMRFIDRVEHQNCKIIVGTAREGYFNKFMCSRVTAFLVKQVEYDSLVNGTWLKERVKAIKSTSDYRLEIPKSDYYVVSADTLTSRHTFAYVPEIDTKRDNCDLFSVVKKQNIRVIEKSDEKSDTNMWKNCEMESGK
jgi:hypothetical protein